MTSFECACGSVVNTKGVSTHLNTKTHQSYLAKYGAVSNGLNSSQLAFARSEVTNARLIGNPGCGKTRSIIEYCLDKLEKKIITNSKNFIITTFSKNAQKDFVKKGKVSSMPNLFTNDNIRTIHSLASMIFNKLVNVRTTSTKTIVLATHRALENITQDELYSKVPTLNDIKFIIVDEAQDLNYNQYHFIIRLSNILNASFIMVGDPNQSIYQFQGSSDKYLIEHSGNTFSLIENYRSTNQIVDFINGLRPHDDLPLMKAASNRNGPKPVIYNGTRDSICNYIVNMIRDSDLNYEDIAIIGAVKRSNIDNSALGVSLIIQHLYDNDIPYVQHFKDGNDRMTYQTNIGKRSGHINLLTCHGSKGLEFKLTIVIGYHTRTMGRCPTTEDYEIYKYLWYVGLSRAIDKLVICCESNKDIFSDIQRVSSNLYEVQGIPLRIKMFEPKVYPKPREYKVTGLIYDAKIMSEEACLNLEELKLYSKKDSLVPAYIGHEFEDIIDNDKFSILYGNFMERLFMFYYYDSKNTRNLFVNWLKKRIQSIVFVDKQYQPVLTYMKEHGILDMKHYVHSETIANTPNSKVNNLIQFCRDQTNTRSFFLFIKNPAVHYNKLELIEKVDNLMSSSNPEKDLFQIMVYFYQMEHEKKQLLNFDFTDHLAALSCYFKPVYDLAKSYNDLEFEKDIHEWGQYPTISGTIDAINTKTGQIIELKFSNNINLEFEIQTLLYYNMCYPDWRIKTAPIAIINLKHGIRRVLSINEMVQPWTLNTWLADTIGRKISDAVFILDLETNTIDERQPFTDINNIEIIDRYVYEYRTKSVLSEGLIRNKYPLTTSHITNIHEFDMYRYQADNDIELFKKQMGSIFKYCKNPIFIAHNGHRFDFPIMERFDLLTEFSKKVDSMQLLHQLSKGECSDKKLITIYNHVFKKNEKQLHRAKADVMLIDALMRHYKIKTNELLAEIEC